MLLTRKSGCKGTTIPAYIGIHTYTIYCFLTIFTRKEAVT